ncbi:MAG: efflux RND transporter periplasmic adaptor subunit [Planctomycetes bacterium]|nr:efflux RND transporter periplasmic adaptor subunit [Planctomycetota bacterium]
MRKYFLLLVLIAFSGCKDEVIFTQPKEPTYVRVQKIELTPVLNRYYRVIGSFEVNHKYNAGFELPGMIKEIFVSENQEVTKGMILASYDLKYYDQLRTKAEALFNKADREYQKANKAGTEVFAPTIIAGLEELRQSAEANLELARLELKKASCKAPGDGIVEKLLKRENEVVASGQPVFYILDIDKLKFQAKVPQHIVTQLTVGGTRAEVKLIDIKNVSVRDEEYAQKPRLTRIYWESNSAHQYIIEFFVDNRSHDIRPGMLAEADIILPPYENMYVYNLDWVVIENDVANIWFKQAEKAQAYRLRLENWEIVNQMLVTSEKPPFNEVITEGYHDLADNEIIQVID